MGKFSKQKIYKISKTSKKQNKQNIIERQKEATVNHIKKQKKCHLKKIKNQTARHQLAAKTVLRFKNYLRKNQNHKSLIYKNNSIYLNSKSNH